MSGQYPKQSSVFSVRCSYRVLRGLRVQIDLADLHVMHKKRMISTGRYNPDFDAVLLIPIQKLVIDKNLKEETTANFRDAKESITAGELCITNLKYLK